MYPSAEQIVATRNAGMDALIALAQVQFAAFEQLSALNLNAGKALFEGGVSQAKALMSARGVQDMIELHAVAAQPAFDKVITYSRDLNSLAAKARAEAFRLSESRAIELNRTVISVLDYLTKAAPAGSGVAVTAIKSVLAATNAAYESYANVVAQVPDMAEGNTASSTVAVVKHVGKRKAA